jgi:uncharacterized protein YcbK (DUF882 family)
MQRKQFKEWHFSKILSAAAFFAVMFCHSGVGNSGNAEGMDANGLGGDGKVTFNTPANGEHETFVYRDSDGVYDFRTFEKISHFFRCKLTGEEHFIDPQLVELLDAVEDHFHAHAIDLISAYRSPKRNALLRRQGHRVARNSLHMFGQAADIKIAGVSAPRVRDFALKLAQGGIGYYGSRNFVHLDTGKQRAWGFRPKTALRNRATLNK